MNTVIYADFESILAPYSTCDIKNGTSQVINNHVPCGYSISVLNNHNNTNKQTYYRGDNAVSKLCKEIRAIAYKKISFCKSKVVELTLIENATYCHICKKVFCDNRKHTKVCDHDHYTGKYRGAAHSICNLRYSTQKVIPVLFHNGSNYDFNLTITELAEEFKSELRCIPVNTNKYMLLSIPIKKKVYANSKNTKKKLLTYNLKFIDSARHMNESLS